MISALDHVALSVKDLDRSLAFYRDLLGLEVVRVLDCPPDTHLDEVVGMPGCSARIAHLKLGEGMLEIFEYADPRGRPLPPGHRQADHGWVHLGFTSSDTRSDYERLRAQGVRFIREPLEFRPNVWICYFYGPDGEVCELRQTEE
jgi:catechol 2,3-dioxygenase-like lactoylglutathione lyase family enzyme